MSAMIEEGNIEQIVAEVVRRLQRIADRPEAESKSSQGSSPAASRDPASQAPLSSDELRLTDRLVTLASLNGRLIGKKRVLVGPKAVVTPAVVDELKRAGIVLQRQSVASAKSPSLLLINAASEVDVGGIALALQEIGQEVEMRQEKEPATTLRTLQSVVRTANDLATVITRQPELLLIMANRVRTLRTVQFTCASRLTEQIRTTGANVLILDPTGRGEREMIDCLLEFRKQMPRQVPGNLA